jgi:hypothetical protein
MYLEDMNDDEFDEEMNQTSRWCTILTKQCQKLLDKIDKKKSIYNSLDEIRQGIIGFGFVVTLGILFGYPLLNWIIKTPYTTGDINSLLVDTLLSVGALWCILLSSIMALIVWRKQYIQLETKLEDMNTSMSILSHYSNKLLYMKECRLYNYRGIY